MKKLDYSCVLLVVFLILPAHILIAQSIDPLLADAGQDTALCAENWQNLLLGGSPSASGGSGTYEYAWSAEYKMGSLVFTASDFLEDTSDANPLLLGSFHDSLRFYLDVTDDLGASARDSVQITFSEYIACLGEFRKEIPLGDSVLLGHCVTGGIAPLSFSWSPSGSLSDPSLENPWASPGQDEIYTLTITDSIGCQATSTFKVFVYPSGEENHLFGEASLSVYPNPARDQLNFNFRNQPGEGSCLRLVAPDGRILLEREVIDLQVTLDISELGPGVYHYIYYSGITAESGSIVMK